MSRGPGRVERAIAAILDAEPENAFTTDDLCERIYCGINRVEKKHRVAVLRAADNLMKRRDTLDWWKGEGLGGVTVYFNRDNVMSYAMARLKANNLNHYRSNDDRWFSPTGWFRDGMGFKKGYVYQWPRRTEEELRARLAEGGEDHHLVAEGGVWWKHTRHHIAVLEAARAGDTSLLEEIKAKNALERERALNALTKDIKALGQKPQGVQCTFCGKSEDQVEHMFTQDRHAICNECVDFCVERMKGGGDGHKTPTVTQQ